VAALAGWHADNELARAAAEGAAIPAHARLETYSVLTRLPPPHRRPPDVASTLVARSFLPSETLVPSPRLNRTIVERCHEQSIEGSAVYDVLVALTAAKSKHPLVTRDERAAHTYTRL
jgi:hypothetical protein